MLQVSSRIWEDAVVSLHALREPSALIAWLPGNQPDGKAGGAAALLGNLAQVSASALQVSLHFYTYPRRIQSIRRCSMPIKKASHALHFPPLQKHVAMQSSLQTRAQAHVCKVTTKLCMRWLTVCTSANLLHSPCPSVDCRGKLNVFVTNLSQPEMSQRQMMLPQLVKVGCCAGWEAQTGRCSHRGKAV